MTLGFYIAKSSGFGNRQPKTRYLVPDFIRPIPSKDKPNRKQLGPPTWDFNPYYAFVFPSVEKAEAYASHYRMKEYVLVEAVGTNIADRIEEVQ